MVAPDPNCAGLKTERDATTDSLLSQLADTTDPAGCAELREALVLNNMELARALASRYAGRGVAIDDLAQVANLALVKAVQAFDPQRSDKFRGFVAITILGELKRHFRDVAWSVKPTRRVQELQLRIKTATSELAQELNEPPTTRQLADHLDASVPEIEEALSVRSCFSPSSLDRRFGGHRNEQSLGDSIAVTDPGFDRSETAMVVAPLIASLSPRDRQIIYLRFYDEWTQARIASELGTTQMQISRILRRVMARFKVELIRQDLGVAGDV